MKYIGQGHGTRTDPRDRATQYATADEFCAIFRDNMKRFYLLALWLTASETTAEQCFTAALNDCRKSTGVFRPWAYSWSQLAVVKSAIRLVQPKLSEIHTFTFSALRPRGIPPSAQFVMALNPFDRFVYVLSVLDRYSSRDCAILLGCRRHDVQRAKRRVFEGIAATAGPAPAPVPAMDERLTLRA